MALPDSIDEFLVPKQLPQNWSLSFGPAAWFRLPGFEDKLNKIRLPVKGKTDTVHPFLNRYTRRLLKEKQYRERAVAKIPEAWKERYPHLNWVDLPGEKQIRGLLNNPQIALTLDRAAMILGTIEAILEDHGAAAHNLRDYVCISPAIYRLGGFNDTFFKANFAGKTNEERFQELQSVMLIEAPAFYHDMSSGHTATRASVELLAKACAKVVPSFTGEVETLMSANGAPGPARNEILYFSERS